MRPKVVAPGAAPLAAVVLGVLLLGAVVLGAIAVTRRGGGSPAPPPRAKPSQRFGDDADLMRRLGRERLMRTSR